MVRALDFYPCGWVSNPIRDMGFFQTMHHFLVTNFHIRKILYFLNTKFLAFSHLLCLYSWVCVGPVWKPHCWFSHDVAHLSSYLNYTTISVLTQHICCNKSTFRLSKLSNLEAMFYSCILLLELRLYVPVNKFSVMLGANTSTILKQYYRK